MKAARLSIGMSERRLNKLRQYAASKDKTVTQIVEDWVDRLPVTEIDRRWCSEVSSEQGSAVSFADKNSNTP